MNKSKTIAQSVLNIFDLKQILRKDPKYNSTNKHNQEKELQYNNLVIDHKRDEELLVASEIRYRRLFESAKDGILILDAEDGMIIDVNPFLVEMLGYSKEQFVQKAIWEIGAFYDIVANHDKFIELQQQEYVRYDDLPLKTANGRIINVEFVSNVYLVENHKVIQCNIRDITQRKLADEALIHAKEKAEESDRLKTAFLHNISHEIRTPMNAIVGFSRFLNDPELLPEKRQHFIDIIVQSSDQLLSIISDIVSMSTIEAGQEKIVVNEIELNATLTLLHVQFLIKAKKQNVSLELTSYLTSQELWINTDEIKLMQILTNLVDNAIKFTKNGFIKYGYEVKDDLIKFYVEDTGIGIPPEMHEDIFKRFRQVESSLARQFGGSGLGLAISNAYVEMLGGKMWLKSEINKGSTFYFTIPYIKAKRNILSEKQFIYNIEDVTTDLKTILVAEDEDSNFIFLKELLSSSDIKIIRALNGLEATEICKTNMDIDLVLMDIKMPVMDGYEATKQIKVFKSNLPIIAQTAYSTEIDMEKAMACGCSDYISKPIKRELLLSKIKNQLNKSIMGSYTN